MNLMRFVPRRGTLPAPAPVRANGRRPVLLLHGSFGSSGNLAPLANVLKAREIPAIGVDYADRGVGDLHKGLDEIATAASDVLAKLEAAGARPRIDVVGHSLGGFMGLQLARLPEFQGKISTLVGLGAAFKGMPNTMGPLQRRLMRTFFGPSFEQLCDHEFDPADVPKQLRIVSFLSDADNVVPRYSSELGQLRQLHGISHSALSALNLPVLRELLTAHEHEEEHAAAQDKAEDF